MADDVWDNEIAAAALVVDKLGAQESVPRDVSGAQNTHDFDVMLRDGRLIALEVTQAIDGNVPAFLEGPTPALPNGVYGHWHVSATPATRRSKLDPHLGSFIQQMVCQGQDEAFLGPYEADPAAAALYDRGLRAVCKLDSKRDLLEVGLASQGSSYGLDDLVQLVEVKAKLPNKVDKLKAAESDERHLFVWVDLLSYVEMTSALLEEALPTEIPQIPESVDRVWLAGNWSGARVISYSRNHGWVEH